MKLSADHPGSPKKSARFHAPGISALHAIIQSCVRFPAPVACRTSVSYDNLNCNPGTPERSSVSTGMPTDAPVSPEVSGIARMTRPVLGQS